jgi:hypothetical protein
MRAHRAVPDLAILLGVVSCSSVAKVATGKYAVQSYTCRYLCTCSCSHIGKYVYHCYLLVDLPCRFILLMYLAGLQVLSMIAQSSEFEGMMVREVGDATPMGNFWVCC